MKIFNRRYSLVTDFIIITIVIISVIMSYFVIRINSIQTALIEKKMSSQAKIIENFFLSRITYSYSILGYMGRRISQRTSETGFIDLKYIDHLFQTFCNDSEANKELLSYTLIGWVDNKYNMVVTGNNHILKTPTNLSSRDYLIKTSTQQWIMKLGQPVIGAISGKPIIPGGVGVSDKNGEWLGTIIMGFQESYLGKMFSQIIDTPNTNVALIDSAGQIIVESPNHFISNNISIADKIRKIDFTEKSKSPSYSQTGLLGFGINYYYYKIPDYDYAILIALNNPISLATLKQLLIKNYLELAFLSLIAILCISFLKIRVINPIKNLSNFAKEISSGNTNFPLKKSKFPSIEIFYLAKTMLKVAHYINKEKIVKEELQKTNSELAIAESKATIANKQLKDYMNIVAHDICSPLTSAIGFAEIMKNEMLGKHSVDLYKEYSENIYHVANHVVDFANDLLETARYEFNGKNSIYELLNLEKLIGEVVKLQTNFAHSRGIEIIEEYDITDPHIILSESKYLLRIFTNILSNAIKYSKKDSGSRVWISVKEEIKYINVIFKDEGYGISDPNEAIKPYNSVAAPNKNENQSHGLGLYSCSQLINKINGKMIIESSEQSGTTIYCKLPTRL